MPASVRSDEYYVNMMIAWFFATALAKQWDATIPYLQDPVLEPWTHNKTIQKDNRPPAKKADGLLQTQRIKVLPTMGSIYI